LATGVSRHLAAASEAGLQIRQAPADTTIQGISEASSGANAKPEVLYVGADFCPYCAAMRWPLVVALMRFGTFDGLETMRSSASDVHPNTTTLTFADATYTSSYLHFRAIETADRKGKALQPLTGKAAGLLRHYDAPPYTSHTGGIPFLYIGGRWLLLGSPVDPRTIGTTDWETIGRELADPHSRLAKAVLPQANLITAAICDTIGGEPTAVCRSPGVTAAAEVLPPR
jgi:hypothetical protein